MKLTFLILLQLSVIKVAVLATVPDGSLVNSSNFDPCLILMHQFSANKSAAPGLQVVYRNAFMLSEANPLNYDLIMSLFLHGVPSSKENRVITADQIPLNIEIMERFF